MYYSTANKENEVSYLPLELLIAPEKLLHLVHLTTHRLNEMTVLDTRSKAIWEGLFDTLLEEAERDASSEGKLRLAVQATTTDRIEDKENETERLEGKAGKSGDVEEKEEMSGKGKAKADKNIKRQRGRHGKGGDRQGLSDGTNTQKKNVKVRAKTTKEIAALFVDQLVDESVSHLMRIASSEYHAPSALKDLSRGMFVTKNGQSCNNDNCTHFQIRLYSNKR